MQGGMITTSLFVLAPRVRKERFKISHLRYDFRVEEKVIIQYVTK